jgi:predicted secreted protein
MGRAPLTEAQNGTTRRVAVGSQVEIRLRAQPGTGFSWIARPGTPAVTPAAGASVANAIPGGFEIQAFRFQPTRAGRYSLVFSYDQPWRGGMKGARVVRFVIEAR